MYCVGTIISKKKNMSVFRENLLSLFRPSNTIRSLDFYHLRSKVLYWNNSKNYPSFSVLPLAIGFPSNFWTKVKEMYRHTLGDKHERAITVWWADGEVVLTENLRGETSKVNIPKQRVSVSYKPVSPTSSYAEKMVKVNGKIYSRRRVSLASLKNKKKVEISFLFNMHTHPPRRDVKAVDVVEVGQETNTYSFFSATDLRSFLGSNVVMTGLITDKLWILMKTNRSPNAMPEISEATFSPRVLTDVFKFRVYRGEFGRKVIKVS